MTRNTLAASLIASTVGLFTGTAQGQATVYEGFDYAETGNTTGLNGGTGFASGWEQLNVWWKISSPGSTHGSLSVTGNKATSITRSGITRSLNSDLSNAGLLDNGSTLWFSAIVDITTGSAANSNLGFALTNSLGFRAPSSNPAWHDLDNDGVLTDEGIGFAYNAFGQIGGAYWQDDDAGADAYSERVFSDDRIVGVGTKLILGKIEWGADGAADEKLSLYEPDASLNIGTAVLADWTVPALDQGTFNRIALMGKDTPSIDEIRFGATSADVMPGPTVVLFCFGDGLGTPCPCANHGLEGEGCANGSGSGGKLRNTGTSSITAADLALQGSQLIPNQPGLYFQGNNAVNSGNGNPFGDGLRCAGGGVIRLQVRSADSAGDSATNIGIALAGGVASGDTKRYQLWYRDPMSTPCGNTFNLTNGVEINYTP